MFLNRNHHLLNTVNIKRLKCISNQQFSKSSRSLKFIEFSIEVEKRRRIFIKLKSFLICGFYASMKCKVLKEDYNCENTSRCLSEMKGALIKIKFSSPVLLFHFWDEKRTGFPLLYFIISCCLVFILFIFLYFCSFTCIKRKK